MMRCGQLRATLVVLAGLASVAGGHAADKRVPLPRFSDAETDAIFFPDVFSRLVGARPENRSPSVATSPEAATSQSAAANAGELVWSQIVSATTIEDEVKSIKRNVDQQVTTPSSFSGGGHKEVRRDFSLLAMLFGIIESYDGDVRWKESAGPARRQFARAAANAKAGGNRNVYQEAKLRKQDLDDLLRGARFRGGSGEGDVEWGDTADRAPLMQRLEVAHQRRLTPWTSSADAFSEHVDDVFHEAEMIAAIAETLTLSGMEDGDDDDYAALAARMKQAARGVVSAIQQNSYEQAQQAVGEISKACADCHELYR